MAGRTRIPAAAVALPAARPVIALMLLWPPALLLAAARRWLAGPVRVGRGAGGLLIGTAGVLGVWPLLLPPMIAMAAAAMALLAIAACGVIPLPVLLLLRLVLAYTLTRLTFAVLIGPVTALAALCFSLRPAMMLPPRALTLRPLELRLGPSEPPNFFELRICCCGVVNFALTGCRAVRGGLCRLRGRSFSHSGGYTFIAVPFRNRDLRLRMRLSGFGFGSF